MIAWLLLAFGESFGMNAPWLQISRLSFGQLFVTIIPCFCSAARIGIQPYIAQTSPDGITLTALPKDDHMGRKVLYILDRKLTTPLSSETPIAAECLFPIQWLNHNPMPHVSS